MRQHSLKIKVQVAPWPLTLVQTASLLKSLLDGLHTCK